MTNQAKPARPPAHDLSAFDLTRRSPEQLAQSFVHWKAQRKRSPEEPRASQPPPAQSSAAVTKDTAPAPSIRAKSVEYSATFSELLAAGSEPTVQQSDRPPIVRRRAPKRFSSPGRRLKAMSVFAGAASILALAGGALLEVSDWPTSEAEPEVAQIEPRQVPPPAPIASAATSAPEREWNLQRTVDLALMRVVPSIQAKPKPPMIQTASKVVPAPAESKSAKPASEKDTPTSASFVAKPFVPAPAPAWTSAARGAATSAPPVAASSTGDPRPDALFQHNRNKSASANGAVSNRVAPADKPGKATGSKSAVEVPSTAAPSATVSSKTATNAGGGDPRGESSGGARVGPDVRGEAGVASDAANGATDAGGGNTGGGNTGGGNTGTADGGSAAGDAGDGSTGGGGTAGNGTDTSSSDTGSSGTGDNATGSGGTGGDAAGSDGSSDSGGSSDGDDGASGGIGGAIGGALGGLGDALGGALGGRNSTPDSED